MAPVLSVNVYTSIVDTRSAIDDHIEGTVAQGFTAQNQATRAEPKLQ